MKDKQNFTHFKKFQISPVVLHKINGGDKRATAKADEVLE